MPPPHSSFSAAEPALGYIYQIRYALLQTLRLPEQTICCIEKDDDIDFSDPEEGKILASLKHKAVGDTLTNLSPDFWKSVRIWLDYYIQQDLSTEPASFFLCTTGRVSVGSFLAAFLPRAERSENLAAQVTAVLSKSESKTINKTRDLLDTLPADKWEDFFERITIFDDQVRIQDIPGIIVAERFRPIRPQFRIPVYERLEGWWVNACVDLLSGERNEPMRGSEVSEKLGSIAEQFREDSLPIDFEHAEPEGGVDPGSDHRFFVKQLRAIGLRSERLKRAILDYYRAFEQRSCWLRENVTLSGELEQYDDRLVDEWARIKEIVWEELADESPEDLLQDAGRRVFTLLSTAGNANLLIRANVTATFVTIGSYHMLANDGAPRVHWHPRFLDRVDEILNGGKP